jgi:hypothetical protein
MLVLSDGQWGGRTRRDWLGWDGNGYYSDWRVCSGYERCGSRSNGVGCRGRGGG